MAVVSLNQLFRFLVIYYYYYRVLLITFFAIHSKKKNKPKVFSLSVNNNITSEFDPLDNEMINDLDEWLHSVAEYAKICNWPDHVICLLAQRS